MSGPFRVLYAEDNDQDADLTRVHFSERAPDLELEIVATGRGCLERLSVAPPDVLLLDNHLPDMEGLDVLRSVVRRRAPIPVVLVTGVGDEDLVVRALRLGASNYVPKAGSYLETLPDLLRTVIERHRLGVEGRPARQRAPADSLCRARRGGHRPDAATLCRGCPAPRPRGRSEFRGRPGAPRRSPIARRGDHRPADARLERPRRRARGGAPATPAAAVHHDHRQGRRGGSDRQPEAGCRGLRPQARGLSRQARVRDRPCDRSRPASPPQRRARTPARRTRAGRRGAPRRRMPALPMPTGARTSSSPSCRTNCATRSRPFAMPCRSSDATSSTRPVLAPSPSSSDRWIISPGW